MSDCFHRSSSFLASQPRRQRSIPLVAVLRSALLALLLAWQTSGPALAQSLARSGVSAETAKAADVRDPYGRDSPRGLATGLINALGRRDFTLAARYLDASGAGFRRNGRSGTSYARRLQTLLDSGGSMIGYLALSDAPTGRVDDGLRPDQERIGAFPRQDGRAPPIIAEQRVENGARIWLVSADTLKSMPAPSTARNWRASLPTVLTTSNLFGAPLIDWLLLGAIAAAIYGLVRIAFAIALAILARFKHDREAGYVWRIVDAGASPLSLFIGLTLLLVGIQEVDVAIVARQLLSRYVGGVFFIALAWFAWRMIDVATFISIRRMDRTQRMRAKSAILFARRAAKIILVAIAIIAALGTFGINVTTGLAALGLGGLALALGAQKTIENVVGSVSVIADELVRVGDSCKVGEVTGVVEEIGIRSTRIRTAERTRVSIPNGNLAAMVVENLTMRDRTLFNPVLRLAPTPDAGTIERTLDAVRGALRACDELAGGARANLKTIGTSALEIETSGYFRTTDGDEAAVLRERLLLAIMRAIADAGGALAFPDAVARLDDKAADPGPASSPARTA